MAYGPGLSCLPSVSILLADRKASFGEKMSANNDWFQISQVSSFAQMLQNNLPVQPLAHSLESCSLLNMASEVIQVTDNFPEPLISKGLSSVSNPVQPPKPKYVDIYNELPMWRDKRVSLAPVCTNAAGSA